MDKPKWENMDKANGENVDWPKYQIKELTFMRQTLIRCLHESVAEEDWHEVSNWANMLRGTEAQLYVWKFKDAERDGD